MGAFDFGSALRGGIEGALSGLPEGARVVQALRTAADQQSQLAERKRQFDIEQGVRQSENAQRQGQQDFQNNLSLRNAGGVPVDASGAYPVQPPSSFAGMPGMPTGGLPTSVQASPSDTMTTPGGASYRMPTQAEQVQGSLDQKVNEAKAVEGAKQFNLTLPGPLGEMLGMPHGSTVTVQHAPTAEDYNRMGETAVSKQNADTKANAPAGKSANHIITSTNDKGDVTTTAFDPETGKQAWTQTQRGVGPQRKEPLDPNAPAKEKPPTKMDFNRIEEKKANALSKAKADYVRQKADITIPDEERKANFVGAIRQAQDEYENGIGTLAGNKQPHDPWADNVTPEHVGDFFGESKPQQANASNGKQTGTSAKPAPAAAKAAAPAPAKKSAPKYNVGDSVTYQGKPHKVMAVENGKLVLQPTAGQ